MCRWCHAGTDGSGRGPGSISGAGGLPALPLWQWALCSYCSFPWCQGVVSCILFGCTQGCLVLCVGSFPPLQCALDASCRCQLPGALCAPVLVLLVRARWPALRLGVCLWGFLLLFALLHLFPLLHLFVTNMPIGPISLNTPHTHHTASCATQAPATDTAAWHPPRARQGAAQRTYN